MLRDLGTRQCWPWLHPASLGVWVPLAVLDQDLQAAPEALSTQDGVPVFRPPHPGPGTGGKNPRNFAQVFSCYLSGPLRPLQSVLMFEEGVLEMALVCVTLAASADLFFRFA